LTIAASDCAFEAPDMYSSMPTYGGSSLRGLVRIAVAAVLIAALAAALEYAWPGEPGHLQFPQT